MGAGRKLEKLSMGAAIGLDGERWAMLDHTSRAVVVGKQRAKGGIKARLAGRRTGWYEWLIQRSTPEHRAAHCYIQNKSVHFVHDNPCARRRRQ